ncbi:MAG: hypothetical protein M0R51_11150 [Clostridia bacterium]|nr:hypothetical protein [Clostridia bacterium]
MLLLKIIKKLLIHENAETINDYVNSVSNVSVRDDDLHPVTVSHWLTVLFTLLFVNIIESVLYLIFNGGTSLSEAIATEGFTTFILLVICIDVLYSIVYLMFFSKLMPSLAIKVTLWCIKRKNNL